MTFDINAFMQQPVTAVLDTSMPLYPTGTYTLQVEGTDDSVKFRTGKSKATNEDWVSLDLKCRIVSSDEMNIADIAKERGASPDKLFITHSVMLAVNASGALLVGSGKNVDLGALREAVGQNTDKPWAFGMLKGQVFKAKVGTRADKEDPEKLYQRISMVTKAQ